MIWIAHAEPDVRIALFVGSFRVIISLRHVWVAEVYDVFHFRLYLVRFDFGRTNSR